MGHHHTRSDRATLGGAGRAEHDMIEVDIPRRQDKALTAAEDIADLLALEWGKSVQNPTYAAYVSLRAYSAPDTLTTARRSSKGSAVGGIYAPFRPWSRKRAPSPASRSA